MKSSTLLLASGLFSAFIANLILTPILIRLSHTNKWYDEIDHRKIHEGDIPRIGGFGIFISFCFGSLVMFVLNRFVFAHASDIEPFRAYWPLFVGMLLIHALGLVDDFINVKPWIKIVVEVLAAVLVIIFGYPLLTMAFPEIGISFRLGPFSYAVSLVWIIGMTNAMNLVDGLDGLAGGISAIAALSIGVISLALGNYITASMGLILFGSIVGFLVFNFPPAKIFMGDGGSLFLGFTVATLPFFGNHDPVRASLLLITAITVSLVPILDTFSSMLRRAINRKPFYHPDRAHLHHKLLDIGLKNHSILIIIYAFCLILGGICLLAALFDHPLFTWLIPASWVVSILFFIILDRVYKKKTRE